METRRTRSSTRASALASNAKISPPIAKASSSKTTKSTKSLLEPVADFKSLLPQFMDVKPVEEPIKTSKEPKPVNDLYADLSKYKKLEENLAKRKVKLEDVKELQRRFKTTIDNAKRDVEKAERKRAIPKASLTRSGLRRGAPRQTEEYTQGKFIVKGMDDVREEFAADELEYLERDVRKVKEVCDLKFIHLKYLMKYKFHEDLKKIKSGEVESEFHDRFHELRGKCINELRAEIRMSLFKSEQRDYINGFLQELFEANKKNDNGDIKHLEICYVETVMLYETVLKIVGFIHNISSHKELLSFLEMKSRMAYGISSDSEDDDQENGDDDDDDFL